jgi:hypothetical protein
MRAFVVVAVVMAIVGASSPASADGGAYFILDETYYVAGDRAVATTYVAIPKSRISWLARGPFYAYVLDDGSSLRPGSPPPTTAARVGTFTVKHEDGSYEFEAEFTVPTLAPGWHTLNLCNDPCTITGFREPLTGSFFVVQTPREAALMIENGKLRGQLAGARRDASKAERALSTVRQDLAAATARSADRIAALETQLATATAPTSDPPEGLDPWLAMAIGAALGLVVLALGLRIQRMRRRATPGALSTNT